MANANAPFICLPFNTETYPLSREAVEVVIYIKVHIDTGDLCIDINPLNAELNPIRHLLALVGARHIVHVSRVRIKSPIQLTTSQIGAGDMFIYVVFLSKTSRL